MHWNDALNTACDGADNLHGSRGCATGQDKHQLKTSCAATSRMVPKTAKNS